MKGYMDENRNNDEMIEENSGKKQHVRDFLKRGLAVGLSAAMIGGLAVGSMVSAEESGVKSNTISLLKMDKEETSEDSRTKGSMDVSDIVEEAMPSVVSITTKSVQEVIDYFNMFGYGGYAPQQREVEGRGSGVIIGKNDNELLIATNFHVVNGAETISVGFINNTAVEGKVKGYDEEKDLAVVSVKREDIDNDTLKEISIAKVGSSDDTKVGEQVVAIGNAMGYGQSVTTGIVSAKIRYSENNGYIQSDDDDSSGVNMLQTDAAINPGNSGGALLNMDGELIGINCAKLASTEVEGMCYAIAISDVDDEVIEDLMNEETREKLEKDEHGILGISGTTVSAQEAMKYGFPEGVYIAEVTDDGPADDAGIREGDFITKFGRKSISTIQELIDYLDYYKPGEEVDLTIIRDGEEKVITVTLGEQTEEYQKNAGIIKDDADDDYDQDDTKSDRDDDRNSDDDYLDEYDDFNEHYDDYDDIWESWGDGLFGGY